MPADSRNIIETARKVAYKAVDIALVQRNWLLGRRIAEEHLDEAGHAEYGKQVIQTLANQLTAEYGGGFDFSSLYKYLRFYRLFPILDSVRPKFGNILSWSHYRTLLQVDDPKAREWYLNEAAEQTWGYRTLQRNISSQYYQRMLMSQSKEVVKKEMLEITKPLQDRLEFIKNPVIAEFLGISNPAFDIASRNQIPGHGRRHDSPQAEISAETGETVQVKIGNQVSEVKIDENGLLTLPKVHFPDDKALEINLTKKP